METKNREGKGGKSRGGGERTIREVQRGRERGRKRKGEGESVPPLATSTT